MTEAEMRQSKPVPFLFLNIDNMGCGVSKAEVDRMRQELEVQINNLKKDREYTEGLLSASKKDVEETKAVLKRKEEELKVNLLQNKKMIEELNEKEEKISKAKNEGEVRSKRIEELNDELRKSHNEIKRISQEGIQGLLNQKNEEFRKSFEMFQELESKIHKKNEEYNGKNQEFNNLMIDIDNKKKEISENQQKLRKKENKLKVFIENIEHQRLLIKEKVEEYQKCQNEMDERVSDIQLKTKALFDLNENINRSNLEITEKNRLISENSERINKLQNEREHLDSQIDSNTQRMNELRGQSETLREEIGKLDSEITQNNPLLIEKKTELKKIQKTFAFFVMSRNSKYFQYRQNKETSEQLKEKLRKLKEEIKEIQIEIDNNRETHLKTRDLFQEAEKELEALLDNLNNKKQEIESLKDSLSNKESEISDLRQKYSEETKKLENLEDSINHLKSEISKKEFELENFNNLLSKINGNLETTSEFLSNNLIKSQNQISYFHEDYSTYKVPFSLYMRPQISESLPDTPDCISTRHIWTCSSSNQFKNFSIHGSYQVQCSSCSKSTTQSFWSCENCSQIICILCKPLLYTCPESHKYQCIQNLTRFTCKVCEKEKLSISLQCPECNFQVCATCSFLQEKRKVLCENNHKLKKAKTIFKCFSCNQRDAKISCECFALCKKCLNYLKTEIAGHPALVCKKQHFLHVFSNNNKKKDCCVCKESGKEMFFCKTCQVFLCDSCANKLVDAIEKQPTCERSHWLTWNPEGPLSEANTSGIGSFMCEICESFYGLDKIAGLV
jgi:chromosome segregation ATPase